MSSIIALASDFVPGLGLAPGVLRALTKTLPLDDMVPIAIRLIVVGIFAAFAKKTLARLKTTLKDFFFPSAYIASTDPAFNWVMTYLAQDPGVQSRLSSFRLSTADIRESKRDDNVRNNRNRKEKGNLLVSKAQASLCLDNVVAQMLPVNERNIRINHAGSWLWIARSDKGFANSSISKETDHLRITGSAFQPDAIKKFLVAAHEVFFEKADSEILIFHPSPANGGWYDPISRPVRTWKSVILPGTVKDELLEDVETFLSDSEKEWYAERGIPHRRGYLLHGRPGAGKTTLATAIASKLKLDIYVVNPAARGMDDGKLNKAFRTCPPGNMILIEDIDCVMPPRRAGSKDEDDDEDSAQVDSTEADPGKFGYAKSAVTLSGLLNAIDGVSSQEDCVLFATTNHPERLDEALSRPGRFDVQVPFFDSDPAQALALFKHFYPPANLETDAEKAQDQLDLLAQTFSRRVFTSDKLADDTDLAVSMAALQGFLLKHRKDPKRAVEQVDDWVKELWSVQQAKIVHRMERSKQREGLLLITSTPTSEFSDNATQAPSSPASPASPTLHTA